MPDRARGRFQCRREPLPALAVVLQQMQRHALRGFRSDAGQAAQCLRQFIESG
jgi:hypothetical protein